MAIKIQDTPNRAAFDVQSAQDLRGQFARNPQEGLKAAAQQFEQMFLQMVMKSMRDTVPQDGPLNSDQTRFYTSLLDQQMAHDLATRGNGVGFARLIEQQLGRTVATGKDLAAPGEEAAKTAGNALPLAASDGRHLRHSPVLGHLPTSAAYAAQQKMATPDSDGDVPATARDFANRVWPHAVEASRSTGIPPQFLVAHSALESGWGRSEIRHPDGSSSHNLFGIKAGKGWTGPTVEATTTEYVNGQPQQVVERFRAYASYAESFRDYAGLLRDSARYSSVIGAQNGTEFARRLQQAGYATDPMYADKLARIINGPTLRQALIG
ncbi:flagellar assembly peptidoglycan hydrolase FlgJ [Azonexus sp.]|jgi:flagellar protein FlgJ|uniref:flagellar assembly peptidoglycan hydrolase FlgJ n=1 Tax=Azonexus sp. TaxID=1872668 RepID=UPI0028291492|nr:flagellar assembly peptidoglycan hydrolase FlgJ [Azonexus sp.]MDR1995062.1 flagellar assembly peptidoglycan hydrolase FlgJ [Azonexus sp.]